MPTYTDRTIVKNREAGQYESYGLAGKSKDLVSEIHTTRVFIDKAADDAMASTTTAETRTGVVVPVKSYVKSIKYYATTGGITANATNYATITISKRDAADLNKTTIGAFATDTVTVDDVVQGVLESFDLSALTEAARTIDAGSALSFEIAKAGTGVIVRAGRFIIELEAI